MHREVQQYLEMHNCHAEFHTVVIITFLASRILGANSCKMFDQQDCTKFFRIRRTINRRIINMYSRQDLVRFLQFVLDA